MFSWRTVGELKAPGRCSPLYVRSKHSQRVSENSNCKDDFYTLPAGFHSSHVSKTSFMSSKLFCLFYETQGFFYSMLHTWQNIIFGSFFGIP